MGKQIRVRKAGGTWVVRAEGAVLAESRAALELTEDGHQPVIYFPRDDIAMAMLDASATQSTCPWKGEASYFSLVTGNGVLKDAAWSYENPKEGVEAIAGHVAFYADRVTVEKL
jgi:uncharacterized protein (DUF427 family)